jgi:integrase
MMRPRKDGTPSRQRDRRKLTDLLVNNFKPENGRGYLVHDTVQKGLLVHCNSRGNRKFKVTYTHHKRTRWISLGDATAITLKQARTLANEIMFSVAQGRDPGAERKAERGQKTFKELHEAYLIPTKKKNKSWRQGDRLIRRYFMPKWKELYAASITKQQVRDIINKIVHGDPNDPDDRGAPILGNQALAACSAVFTWAVRNDICPLNPCSGIDRQETSERDRVVEDSELKPLWDELGKEGMAGVGLKIVLLTGCRPGEAANLKKAHLIDGWWKLPGKPEESTGWKGTKNAEPLDIWPTEHVRELIDVYEPVPRHQMGVVMRDISRRLGLMKAIKPHDLRRTFGTTCTTIGYSREEMDRLLNHVRKSVSGIYDRNKYRKQNATIWEAVSKHLLDIALGNVPGGKVVAFKSLSTK